MNKRAIGFIISFALIILIAILPFISSCSPTTTSTSSPSTTSSISTTTASTTTTKPPVKVIKGQCLFPETDYGYITMNKVIISKINERLADKGIQLDLMGPDTLVPSGELFSAVKMGSVAFSLSDFGFDSQSMPELVVALQLPFSWENYDQDMLFWEKYGALKFFRESYASANIHLTYPVTGPPCVIMLKKEIKTLGDLKGVKIWCGPPQVALVADLGAEPVDLPPPEVYMGLQLGTLDGLLYSEPELETMNFYQVVNYVYHPAPWEAMNLPFVFNMDIWNSFTPEVQNIIDSTVKEFNPEFHSQYLAGSNQGIAFFKSKGGTMIDFPPEIVSQLKQVGRATWDKIAAEGGNVRTAQAVQMLKDFMKGENIQ